MSLSQQMSALDRANEIRLARARLKAAIASGEVFAASVLLDPPAEAETWAVGEMLIAQRRWGDKRARRLLGRQDVPEMKPVGALTVRQRMALAAELQAKVNGSAGGRG